MKKSLSASVMIMLLLVAVCCFASAEESEEWAVPPVITRAYEQDIGKIYIEWSGSAPVYQVYVDGSKKADVSINQCIVNVEKGAHTVVVYPVNEIRDADTTFGLNVKAFEKIDGEISLDLSALGLDPKRLVAGNPSEKFSFDYKPSQIINATPDNLSAVTDPKNRVVLSFADQYFSDEYLITIKHGNNVNYLTYNTADETAAELIAKSNTTVSLVLDPSFLQGQECPAPELNEEYRFTVQLRKYATSLIDGTVEKTVIRESKVSKELVYRVTAAWKDAPVITFASQTADGEITVQWDHEDYGAGCEYSVLYIKKTLGVMTGQEEWGRTSDHEFKKTDLANGSYCINIVPVFGDEKGTNSADANVEIKNEWVIAPELVCEQIGANQVKLTWKTSPNVESYHVTVSTGDNASLLRFVDLDYSKYTEFDLDAAEGDMEYIFTYDRDIDPENGLKMKFEVCGLRHTASGEEQKSATSVKTIVLK